MGSKKVIVTKLPAGRARGLVRPIVSRKGAAVAIEVAPRSKGPRPRPWEATGSIEVEHLVIWTYGEQKADRFKSARLLAAEAAVEGVEPRGRTTDGTAALADIEHLGCRIDRHSVMIMDHVHPVAHQVVVMVDGLESADLVRHYGRLGIRPGGWQAPKRWWRPIVWKVYPTEGQWERLDRGVNAPRATMVIPTITPAELELRRLNYGRWWEALDRLAWQLSMRNLGFAVLRPSAPRAPWHEDAA